MCRSKPQSSLDEDAIALAMEALLWINHNPIKISQQNRDHFVQLDKGYMSSYATKASGAEGEFKGGFHACETGLAGFRLVHGCSLFDVASCGKIRPYVTSWRVELGSVSKVDRRWKTIR